MISKAFKNKKALIPYFTYGDPNPGFTEELICKSFENGADLIEIGLPFSDPIADGPVIQSSHLRALENKPDISIPEVLEMVLRIKQKHEKPLVIMTSVNLIYNFGIKKFFQLANQKKLDGIIIPDLPIEEAKEYIRAAKNTRVKIIFLISPLCSDKRIKTTVEKSSGFVYLISSTGTTGERANISNSLSKITNKIKRIKNIPIAIGFGISKKEHLETVYSLAEGAIIGSFFTKIIEENINDPNKAISEITKIISIFKKNN
jgi:tryptophan synthase alpha chain